MPKKKIFLSVILILGVFVFLAYPLQTFAQSFTCSGIGSWLTNFGGCVWGQLAEALARLFTGAFVFVPGFIFFVVAGVTNWIIGTLINIGVAPGVGPQFVTDGWTFSRNFVNMFFLLILVFIGLATILRLREYELQRTLPKLIIIALLVNFSGLVVGFLADIGNITTVFFTQNITGSTGAGLGSAAFNSILDLASQQFDTLYDSNNDLLTAFLGALALGAVTGFFFIFATIAYFAVALIFFLRLIILWVLVILAPFAFAFYILPITRKWWNQWLDALIQWSFITVPLAFFMFLANKVLANPITFGTPPTSLSLTSSTGANAVGQIPLLIGQMMSPFVAIVLLFIGLGMAAGMSGFIRGGLRFARTAGAVGVGVLGANAVRDWARKRAADSGILRRMEQASSRGAGRNPFKQAGRLFNPFARAAARNVRGRARQSLRNEARKAEAEAADMETDEIMSHIKGRGTSDARKAGLLSTVAKRDDIDDAFAAGLTNEELIRIAHEAERFDMHRDIIGAVPQSQEARMRTAAGAPPVGTPLNNAQRRAVGQQYYNDVLSRLTPERFARMSRRVFERNTGAGATGGIDDFNNSALMEGLVRNVTADRMGAFLRKHGEQGAQAIEEFVMRSAGTTGMSGAAWLQANNQRLADYIANNPAARGLFDRVRLGFP